MGETWEMTGGIKIVSEQNLGSYVTIQPTNTTNTFTPTTLKTIEQMFVDVEEPETYKNQAGFAPPTLKHKTYINMDSSNWQQGGVTTVVTPSAAPPPSFELLQPSNQEEEKKVNRGGGRKPRDKEEETLCPEEEERRKMRWERNKLAAARCRKRRVDQTESLQDEVNLWEGKKKALQEQIQQLQEEKNQLDFNALMDGRTGLTPTNILTPIMVNMTTSSSSSSSGLLQTPTVSTPSCGSQQRTNRSTVLQELGSPNTGGHLVSL